MYALGELIPGMKSVIYGFNFLLGVIAATIVKNVMSFLRKKNIITRKYRNSFLLNHISNMCFDVMIVAGIAAIRIDVVKEYWYILVILGVAGFCATYFYNLFVAKKLFPEYSAEQFMCMYGMLTGTASTGVMLLRELDPLYKTDAKDNLIYQNFPAIVFGFPLMLLANLAPKQPVLTFVILLLFFIVMNIILFRRQIFKRRKKSEKAE
jgi:ESS family glutamate:Na+ symporter